MISGLALGLSAFGDSLATKGQRGGVQEVEQVQAEQQQQKLQAQEAAAAQKNQQIQQQVVIGDTNRALAQSYLNLMTMPDEIEARHLQITGTQQTQAITGADFQAQHGGMTPQQFTSALTDTTPVARTPNSFFATNAQQELQAGQKVLGGDDPYVKNLQGVLANPKATPKDLWTATSQLTGQRQRQADASKQLTDNAAATKAQLGVAPVSPDQITSFTGMTLPSYTHIPAQEKRGYMQQAKQARTVDELTAIQNRALASEQALTVHQDSMDATAALAGNKFAEAGLSANEKLINDSKTGFLAALQQTNQTLASIKAGADGNALLANLVPTMEVLGVNHAAGISRISPEEAKRAGTSPDWATRWNAWATAASKGKLTPELAAQGQQLMNIVTNAAYSKYIKSAQVTAQGHHLHPADVPAVDRDGNITTLDKVSGAASTNSSVNPSAIPGIVIH
jgi:hypothetical protein